MDEKDENICEFCEKSFKNKYTLERHQKTVKKCVKNDSTCSYCTKNISSAYNLSIHLKNCKVKINFEEKINKIIMEKDAKINEITREKDIFYEKLKEKDIYISKIESLLEKANSSILDIAKQPKITHTTTNTHNGNNIQIVNTLDLNDIPHITNVLTNHLTKEVISRGQEGIADMIQENLLKSSNGELMYQCTDVARQKFEFRNPDGNIETDPKATKLIRSLNRSGIYRKALETSKEVWTTSDGESHKPVYDMFSEQVSEVLGIDNDSKKLRSRLASTTAVKKK